MANIFAQYAQPVRSVADYQADMDARDLRGAQLQGLQRQNFLAGLTAQQTMGELADRQRTRNVLAGIYGQAAPGSKEDDILSRLELSGDRGAVEYAAGRRKALLDQRNTQSQIDERGAKTAKEQQALQQAQRAAYIQHLGTLTNPQAARDSIANDPTAPEDFKARILPTIPDDPQQYAAWLGRMVLSAASPEKQATALLPNLKEVNDGKTTRFVDVNSLTNPAGPAPIAMVPTVEQDRNYELKASNELIGPGGKINQPVIAAKSQIAKAGKTDVNLSVSTEKGYAGKMAEGLAKQDLDQIEAARTAGDRAGTARAVKRVLESNQAITGTGAEMRLALNKALATAGIVDDGKTTATEDLVSMLNGQTLDAIKTSGLGAGQGFTDKDRQFLQDARSGRIDLNPKTLWRMADLNERAALATLERGKKVAQRLKGNPAFGDVGQDLTFDQPQTLQDAIAQEKLRRERMKGK